MSQDKKRPVKEGKAYYSWNDSDVNVIPPRKPAAVPLTKVAWSEVKDVKQRSN